MKKRIMSMLLAITMLFSMLPAAVLADDTEEPIYSVTTEDDEDDESGMTIVKKVSGPKDDGSFDLTIEAYATGSMVEKTPQCDIVLVLDTSSSMVDNLFGEDYIEEYSLRTHTIVDWNPPEYFIYRDGEYLKVTDDTEWFKVYWHVDGDKNDRVVPKTSADDTGVQFYRRENRLDALQKAASGFVDTVANLDAGHRIAIVQFNDSASKVADWTDAAEDADDLKAAINNDLRTGDGTNHGAGLAAAKNLLSKNTDNKQVVIFFTDGEPYDFWSGGYWTEAVVRNAVNTAYDIKNDYQADIYAVSVYDEEDATMDAYLGYISSNYPNAACEWTIAWPGKDNVVKTISSGEKASNAYYLKPEDTEELEDAFEGISDTTTTMETTSVADAESVLKDTLGSNFKFTDVDPTVQIANCTGTDDKPTWGAPVDPDNTVTVTIDNDSNAVSVTGFSYMDNPVVLDEDDGWSGKKLIVTVNIQPDEEAHWDAGKNLYPTNKGAQISNDDGPLTDLKDSPTVPVTKYSITYDANGGKFGEDETVEDTIISALDKEKFTVTKVEPTRAGHTFLGWAVDTDAAQAMEVAYTVDGEDETDTTIDVKADDPAKTVYAVWAKNTYTVTWENYDGSTLEIDPDVEYGSTPSYNSDTPTKEATAEYTYTFKGWDPEFSYVTDDITYTAIYDATKNTYTVTWVDEGGNTIDSDDYNYGDEVEIPADPSKAADETYTYTFDHWEFVSGKELDDGKCVGDATYRATYTAHLNPRISIAYYLEDTNGTPAKVDVEAVGYGDDWKMIVADAENTSYDYTALDELTIGDNHYLYAGEVTEFIFTNVEEAQSVKLVYTIDNWVDDDENGDDDEGGDGIPDYKQVRILYEAAKGGEVDPEISIITIKEPDDEGEYIKTIVDAGSTATPDRQYAFVDWVDEDGKEISTEPETGRITIEDAIGGETYIFTANFKKNQKEPDYPKYIPIPRVQEQEKPAAKINRDDHYAYIVGYPDGTVRPEGNITRAEVATIFFRLLDEDYRDEVYCDENDFYDVNEGDWFNNAVSTLSAAGIMNGYPDGSFKPNAYITRAEMAKVISMFAAVDETADIFSDIDGNWAEAYIELAAGNGWISGYPDGTFRPTQPITRAETMTMVNRVLNRLPKNISRLLDEDEMLTFPDNRPVDWYYIAVQEATNSHSYDRYDTDLSGDEQWVARIPNYDWTLLER